mmetsp:Transcript_50876/g.150003  ORF Transcript_50876/g.150003 Transcript_50876/m.150003 type:complete len:212 (+) Transcript_50876:688-1323(+)
MARPRRPSASCACGRRRRRVRWSSSCAGARTCGGRRSGCWRCCRGQRWRHRKAAPCGPNSGRRRALQTRWKRGAAALETGCGPLILHSLPPEGPGGKIPWADERSNSRLKAAAPPSRGASRVCAPRLSHPLPRQERADPRSDLVDVGAVQDGGRPAQGRGCAPRDAAPRHAHRHVHLHATATLHCVARSREKPREAAERHGAGQAHSMSTC